jgi:hypothetical protein
VLLKLFLDKAALLFIPDAEGFFRQQRDGQVRLALFDDEEGKGGEEGIMFHASILAPAAAISNPGPVVFVARFVDKSFITE